RGFPFQPTASTPPGAPRAFDRHIDDHDVLILQLYGRKFWTLYPDHTAPVEIEIQPGDFLYVPGGLAHMATCPAEPSIHIPVGLHPPYGYRLLEELAAVARTRPGFQTPVPPASASPAAKQAFE